MDKPTYPFRQFQKELLFEFDSVSQTRRIRKVIAYELVDEVQNIFNLALLDILDDGTVDDSVVSNNQDMETVLATVVATIPVFFDKFPEATIVFRGSTPERTRLYRIIISKYFPMVNNQYIVLGILAQTFAAEPFEPNRPYEGFYLKMK